MSILMLVIMLFSLCVIIVFLIKIYIINNEIRVLENRIKKQNKEILIDLIKIAKFKNK